MTEYSTNLIVLFDYYVVVDKAKGLLVLWILLIVFGSVCGAMCLIFPCILCVALLPILLDSSSSCDLTGLEECCSFLEVDDKCKQRCFYCRDSKWDDRGSCSCCQRLWCWRESDIDDWGSCCVKKSDMGGADVGLPVLHVGDTVKSFRYSYSEDGACV